MSEVKQVLDRDGKPVIVGSRVRVVAIGAFLERDLAADEWECVRSMLGQVFEVYEIDKWGGAWVQYQSLSLTLASDEMERVELKRTRTLTSGSTGPQKISCSLQCL